jgi:hypothetical protein
VSFVTLDIETVPQSRFLDPDRWTSGDIELDNKWERDHENDAGVIRCAVQEARAVLAGTGQPAALHATTCHIVQVSFGWRGPMGAHDADLQRRVLQSNRYFSEPVQGVEAAELPLLAEALDIIARAAGKGTTIVSFNGKQFDVPLLRARAALLSVSHNSLPWRKLLYPFEEKDHADLRLILGNGDRRAHGTLQWWADAFGIHAEEHGREVAGWVAAGEWDQLERYGMTEAQTLVELYERVQLVL